MTVALVLAAEADAGMCGQLTALGVRRVDLAGSGDDGAGLLTVAAMARMATEKVVICAGGVPVPGDALARLLAAGGTASYREGRRGALVVAFADLPALAEAAEALAFGQDPDHAKSRLREIPARLEPLTALAGQLARQGVPIRVLDAEPAGDGLVAQRLAEPVAQDLARWALARGLTPYALCGMSLGFGLIAAVWLTSAGAAGVVAAIAALCASFTVGRAAALAAAAGRRDPATWQHDGAASPATWQHDGAASPATDWLIAATVLLTEAGAYAAIAAGGRTGVFTFGATVAGSGQAGLWRLALMAMGLLGFRRLTELTFDRAAEQARLRRVTLRRFEQTVTLPAAERYLVLALVTPLAGARVTFLVLLGWGTIALAYLLTSQMAGAMLATAVAGPDPAAPRRGTTTGGVRACRDDGRIALWIGAAVQGRLPPALSAAVGVFVTCVLSALGLANLPGLLVLTPVEAMLLAGLGSRHPHDGRRDWLVPPLLLAGESTYLAALGLSRGVPAIAVFALLAAVVARHIDIACRARHDAAITADGLGLGWDGRMLLPGLAAVAGIAPLAFLALSGYLWVLFWWDFLGGWLRKANGSGKG